MASKTYVEAVSSYGHCNVILYPSSCSREQLFHIQMSHLCSMEDIARNKVITLPQWEWISVREEVHKLKAKLSDISSETRKRKINYWLLIPIRNEYQYLDPIFEIADGYFLYDKTTGQLNVIERPAQ